MYEVIEGDFMKRDAGTVNFLTGITADQMKDDCLTPVRNFVSTEMIIVAAHVLSIVDADKRNVALGDRAGKQSAPGRVPGRRVERGGAAPSVAAIVSRARARCTGARSATVDLADAGAGLVGWRGRRAAAFSNLVGGARGAAIASRASLRHLAGASLAPGYHP